MYDIYILSATSFVYYNCLWNNGFICLGYKLLVGFLCVCLFFCSISIFLYILNLSFCIIFLFCFFLLSVFFYSLCLSYKIILDPLQLSIYHFQTVFSFSYPIFALTPRLCFYSLHFYIFNGLIWFLHLMAYQPSCVL